MANAIFNTDLFHDDVLLRVLFFNGFLADTFDASGVAEFRSKKGKTLNYNISSIPAAQTLAVTGEHVITDVGGVEVSMSLLGKQSMSDFSAQELNNTAYDEAVAAVANNVSSVAEWVEETIGSYLNLSVTNVVGSVGSAVDTVNDMEPAISFLSNSKVPRQNRWAALNTTSYNTIAPTLLANQQANSESVQMGTIPMRNGLNYREAVYAAITITNGEFGVGALSVKTTAAGGATAFIITGATLSKTGSFVAGTVISIAHASDGVTRNYVIQADADTDASTDAPVTIYPALGAQATATDVVTVLTGVDLSVYKKNFVYHRDGFSIGSRATANADAVHSISVPAQLGWVLTTKAVKADQTTWGNDVLGASTLFNIVRTKPEYSVVLLSS